MLLEKSAYDGKLRSFCFSLLMTLFCWLQAYGQNLMAIKNLGITYWLLHCLLVYGGLRAIVWFTRMLDGRYPWWHSAKRWLRQLAWGLVLPLSVFCLLLGFYGGFVFYVKYWLLLHTLWLCCYNGLLFYQYQRQQLMQETTPTTLAAAKDLSLPYPLEQIALFYAKNKSCFVVNLQGQPLFWPFSLAKTMEILPATKFFLVNRAYIVHRAAIVKISRKGKGWQLFLLPSLALDVRVSRYRSLEFSRWWQDL